MTFDLGDDGSFIRIRDWPRLRSAIADIPKLLIRSQPQGDPKTAKAVSEAVIRPFMSLTAEQAPGILLKGWPSFLGFGGVELQDSVQYEAAGQTNAPFVPVPIPTVVRYSLSKLPDNSLRLQQTSEPDGEKVGEAVAQYVGQMGQGLGPKERANVEKAAELMRNLRIKDHLDIRTAPETGLAVEAVGKRVMSFGSEGDGSETIEIHLD
jgi:hypothetical protein